MPTRYNDRYVIHIDEIVQRERMNSPRKFAQPLLPFLRDGDGVTAFEACGLRVDFSRQRLTQDDLARLVDFANGPGLMEAHHAMVQRILRRLILMRSKRRGIGPMLSRSL